MTPQIIIYPPPGPSLLLKLRSHFLQPPKSVASTQPELPCELQSAIALRFSVFVHEQRYSAENEIDSDDARSWHWVALAAPRDKNGQTEKNQIVAATLRLVPVSSPSPTAEAHQVTPGGLAEGPSHGQTALWDGREPYIKIGRVATLPFHRRMGLGKLLVESALEWAGRHGEILRHRNREHAEEEITEEEEGSESQWTGLILVHAQKAAKRFWERVGFLEDEGMGVWWEEGFEHVGMWRRVTIME